MSPAQMARIHSIKNEVDAGVAKRLQEVLDKENGYIAYKIIQTWHQEGIKGVITLMNHYGEL